MIKGSPFEDFKTSPPFARLAVMMDVRFPLSLRTAEDLVHERGGEICHVTVRDRWHRFGPIFAAENRKCRIAGMRSRYWHLDKMFVKTNRVTHNL